MASPCILNGPGLDEARLTALQNLIVTNLASLNNNLGRDSLTPLPQITSSMVIIGDPEDLPDVSVTPILICVVGGGDKDGLDFDSELYFIDVDVNRGYHYKWYTNIYVYIHPDSFPTTDALAQATAREIARARICDWLRYTVFNNKAGLDITVTSQEYDTTADHLMRGYIQRGYKGYFQKNFAGFSQVFAAHMVHVSEVI